MPVHKHAHGDSHGHSHSHAGGAKGRRLLVVTALNVFITVAEIIGGLVSGSLSLLSDAVHNLGDTLAIAAAYVAGIIGGKKADLKHTFGHKRAEILTAFFNAAILIAICIFLLVEAYERFKDPQPIKGALMITVAVAGFIGNLASMLVLQRDKKENINVRAAYMHLMGDTLSSVAVVMGGVAIWLWGAVWVDPLITVAVSIYIIYLTWGIVRETVDILMQSSPDDIDIKEVIKDMEALPGVMNVHHVHVWRMNEDTLYFESHVDTRDNIDMKQMMAIRGQVEELLRKRGFGHTTLQFGYGCCNNDNSIIVHDTNRL